MLLLETASSFRDFLTQDQPLDRTLSLAFAAHFEHAGKGLSVDKANIQAAKWLIWEMNGDAFTEDVRYPEGEEMIQCLIELYGFTAAYVQSGM